MAVYNMITILLGCVALGSASVASVVPAVPAHLQAPLTAIPAAYSVPYASSYSANVVNHAIAAPVAVQPNLALAHFAPAARLAVASAPVPVAQAKLANAAIVTAPSPVVARQETFVSQAGQFVPQPAHVLDPGFAPVPYTAQLAQAGSFVAASAPFLGRSAPFVSAEYPGVARYASLAPGFAPASLVNAW